MKFVEDREDFSGFAPDPARAELFDTDKGIAIYSKEMIENSFTL